MAAATPQAVLGGFASATATDRDRGATFFRDGDRFVVRTDGPGGAVGDFAVTETLGADPLQHYLVLFPDGRRQGLPWAWDSRPREQGGQRWYHLMPDEPLRAGDPLHWTGRDQAWNSICASCHSTGVARGNDVACDGYDTTWSEISVGCELCHRRGAAYVAWARLRFAGTAPELVTSGTPSRRRGSRRAVRRRCRGSRARSCPAARSRAARWGAIGPAPEAARSPSPG
jgi:hypothetical protein